MAHRKSRLKLKHQDLAINADIRTTKLSPESIQERPEIVRRDERTGSLVVRQVYDKATKEPLEDGHGYRWVNEDGEEGPSEDIQLYAVKDDEESAFTKQEPTVGGERTIGAETWIPVASIDEYLVDKIYEIWGEERMDAAQLYELALHIRELDEAPVVPFVLQPSLYKSWAIITPFFYDESFSLIARVTDQKIQSEHRMSVPGSEEIEEAMQPDPDAPTLDQPSPFE
jgi:hypothetical protein